MVKHVVMWNLKDPSKAGDIQKAILSMRGKIPSLIDLECGINFAPGDAACDLVLISTHKNREELDAYQADPVHGEIKKIMSVESVSRSAVDFEMEI